LKQDGRQAAEQCRRDQQMLAELIDKYQLLRQEKGEIIFVFSALKLLIGSAVSGH